MNMTEAEEYYEYLLKILGVKKQIHVAKKLGVSQPTVAGWLRRNAVDIIRSHISNLGVDIVKVDQEIKDKKEGFWISEEAHQFLNWETQNLQKIATINPPLKFSKDFQAAFFNKRHEIFMLLSQVFKKEEEKKHILDEFEKLERVVIQEENFGYIMDFTRDLYKTVL